MSKIILMSLVALLAGCNTSGPAHFGSVLIVAISQWNVEELHCESAEAASTPNLETLCSESVRFTHAYAPSALDGPSLASLLTGQLPVEHGIHHNGASEYGPKVTPLPEFLRARGVATGFFSGGLPVLKKSGLSEGFEIFDDAIRPQFQAMRPSEAVVGSFLDWMESLSSKRRFLSVIFLNDLVYPELETKSLGDEARETSRTSQLQEIDENLGKLRKNLKKKGIWDGLHVIVMGLGGDRTVTADNVQDFFRLTDTRLHIPLLVKPAYGQRDLVPGWKTDISVDLADVGETLWNHLGQKNPNENSIAPLDFGPALKGDFLGPKERLLISEDDWTRWHGWGDRQYALRKDEIFFQAGPEPKLYNTYVDRFQLHDLSRTDRALTEEMTEKWNETAELLGVQTPMKTPHITLAEKLRVAQGLFGDNPKEAEEDLLMLTIRRSDDFQVIAWLVDFYLESGRFQDLYNFVKSWKPKPQWVQWQKFWKEGAEVGFRGLDVPISEGCLQILKPLREGKWSLLQATAQKGTTCEDQETNLWVLAYAQSRMGLKKEAQGTLRVIRSTTEIRRVQTKLAKANWKRGLIWDLPPEWPGPPGMVDWILALSKNEDFQKFVLGPLN